MRPHRRHALSHRPCRAFLGAFSGAGCLLAVLLVFAAPAATPAPTDSTPEAVQSFPPLGAGQPAGTSGFYAFYFQRHQQAAAAARQSTNLYSAAWELARACFDLGEFATNDTQRAAVAEQGIAASRRAIALNPKHPAGHYYLGMNLGQSARTKQLGALRLVKEMQDAFNRCRELDGSFDYGGADRCLGLLYRDAPGWPLSVGNRRLAREHLNQAFKLAPLYPENPLNWAETLLMWDPPKEAAAQLPAVQAAFVHARTNLTGGVWAASWHDWTNRWRTLTNRLGK